MPDQCLSVPLKTGQKWTMAFPFKKKLLCSADPNEDNGNPVPKRGRVLHDTTRTVYTPSCDKRPVTTI